jgi:hypothetical protein
MERLCFDRYCMVREESRAVSNPAVDSGFSGGLLLGRFHGELYPFLIGIVPVDFNVLRPSPPSLVETI